MVDLRKRYLRIQRKYGIAILTFQKIAEHASRMVEDLEGDNPYPTKYDLGVIDKQLRDLNEFFRKAKKK